MNVYLFRVALMCLLVVSMYISHNTQSHSCPLTIALFSNSLKLRCISIIFWIFFLDSYLKFIAIGLMVEEFYEKAIYTLDIP